MLLVTCRKARKTRSSFGVATNDFDQVRYISALLGDQATKKAVLLFVPEEGGPDAVYTVDIAGRSMEQIRADLDTFGIQYRTLEPRPGGTVRVHVFDQGSKLGDAINQAGGHYDTPVESVRGKGEFLGGDTREEGRAAYARVIRDYEARHPEQAWRPGGGRYQAVPRQ